MITLQNNLPESWKAEIDALDDSQRLWIREQMSERSVALWQKAHAMAAEGYVVQIMMGDRPVSQLMHSDSEKLNGETVSFDMTPRIGRKPPS